MRVRPRGASLFVLGAVLAMPAAARAQQQGSVQLFTQTQILEGSPSRRTGEHALEPDFGIIWLQPGSTFGQFQMEVRASRRGDGLHLGRSSVSLRRANFAGAVWTVDAGDTSAAAGVADTRFTNLSAAPVSFTGVAIAGTAPRWTLHAGGGRTTAWRNIFGSDADTLGQSLAFARGGYKITRRLEVIGRASRVRTSDLDEFARTIDASDEAGGGVRFLVTPSIHFVADGAWIRYRPTGTTSARRDGSYLLGTHILLARGWVQLNASRFSPGEMPVLHATLQNREGVFAAGEYDIFSRVRLFGGWETIDTNLDPAGVLAERPRGRAERGFGGLRVRVGSRSTVSVRLEDGDRVASPVVPGLPTTTSDTGEVSADWQSSLGPVTAFARYARRENVDLSNTSATFTQQDASGQLYWNVSRRSQLFGSVTLTDQKSPSGNGSRFVQFSGGAQQQLFDPGLWLRVEATGSRNRDRLSGFLFPRDALGIGLNGQIAPETTVGFNVYVDRAPSGLTPGEDGWLTRSMLRVTHTIATGSVRANAGRSGADSIIGHGSGTITGIVFADWNANGAIDAGEEQLAGIPVRLGTVVHVTTAHDGQFAFMNVSSGAYQVGLDLGALPVDFDPPDASELTVEISRGSTRRVAFGLLPLGAVKGRVVHDANRNGAADPGEPGLDGAVLTLDDGQRSELAREGAFRFDAVRAGEHRLALLKESLPDGAVIAGDAEQPIAVRRDQLDVDILYLVQLEKRPEIRKVFPPKIGANAPRPEASALAHAARTSPAAARPAAAASSFTIQIAALNDPLRARDMVTDLQAAGFAAYLVDPPPSDPDGPYRIRVGRYDSRTSAQRTADRLEKTLGEKLWVTRGK